MGFLDYVIEQKKGLNFVLFCEDTQDTSTSPFIPNPGFSDSR